MRHKLAGGAILAMAAVLAMPVFAKYEVGVYCGGGVSGIGTYHWYNLVNNAPDFNMTLVDDADIRAGALDGLRMLVMPGGTSTGIYQALKDEGMQKIREFIRNGGGYVGTCAGCFLLLDQDNGTKGIRMHMIPYGYKDAPSGVLFLKHKLTGEGMEALGLTNDTWSVRFHGGAVMRPTTNVIEGAKFEVWAKYASDSDSWHPVTKRNSVSGNAAILGGTYGKGRVVVFGSHPEYFASTVGLVDAAFRYVLEDKSVGTVRRYRRPGARPIAFVPGLKKEAAKVAVALHSADAYDVFPVSSHTIQFNDLEHVDLVVFAEGPISFGKGRIGQIFREYLRNGGKAIVHQPGADIVKEVAEALETVHE